MTEEQLQKIGSESAWLVNQHIFGEDDNPPADVIEAKMCGLLAPLSSRDPLCVLDAALHGLETNPDPKLKSLARRLNNVRDVTNQPELSFKRLRSWLR